jgi:hypothetical protein
MNGVMCHNLIFVEFKYLFLFIHELKMSKMSNFRSTENAIFWKYIKIKKMSINKKYIKIV